MSALSAPCSIAWACGASLPRSAEASGACLRSSGQPRSPTTSAASSSSQRARRTREDSKGVGGVDGMTGTGRVASGASLPGRGRPSTVPVPSFPPVHGTNRFPPHCPSNAGTGPLRSARWVATPSSRTPSGLAGTTRLTTRPAAGSPPRASLPCSATGAPRPSLPSSGARRGSGDRGGRPVRGLPTPSTRAGRSAVARLARVRTVEVLLLAVLLLPRA